jgi:hypothetical protein
LYPVHSSDKLIASQPESAPELFTKNIIKKFTL